MGARFRLAALFGLLAFPAMAQTPMWVANATLSPTTTLSAGHLCATDGRDIYCDGSLPTAEGLGLGDRIVSGTSSVTVNSGTGIVSLTQAGSTWAYLHPSLGLVAPGVSATGTISGTKVIAGHLIAYSFGGEGGQLTLGYANTLPASEVTSTWNIDVSSNNSFRIFRRNASTTAIVPFVISESTGWVGIGGASNPSATLHVAGTGYFTGNVGIGAAVSSAAMLQVNGSGNGGLTLPRISLNNTAAGGANWSMISTNNSNYVGGQRFQILLHDSASMEAPVTIYGQAVGINGVGTPSTTFHVSGSLRLAAESSATLAACNSDRTGAIKYEGGDFSVCRNGASWETLTAIAGGAASVADRLISGSSVVALNSATGIVSLTQAGSTWAYLHPSLGLVTPGVSATGPISGTDAYFAGNVGIGTIPEVALHVSGTLRAQGPVEEAVKGIPRIDIGVQAGTPRMIFEPVAAVSNSLWEVDNLAGRFRWFNPGIERMYLTASSTVSILGAATHAISNMDASNTSVALILRGTSTTEGGGAVLYGVGSTNIYAAIKGAMRNGAQNSAGDIVIATRRDAADPSLTETMRVTGAGSVGIGTANPNLTQRVQMALSAAAGNVSDTITSSTVLFLQNGTGSGTIPQPSQIGLAFGYASARQAIMGGTYGADFLDFYTGGIFTAPRMRLNSAGLSVSGTVSATRFVGDGSGLTNLPGSSADRLTSGSSVVTLNSGTGIVSLTQAGSTWAYLHPSLGLVAPGVSTTGPISGTSLYVSGSAQFGDDLYIMNLGYGVDWYSTGHNYIATDLNQYINVAGTTSSTTPTNNVFVIGARRMARTGGVELMKVTDAASGPTVGIGTANASATLHVSGTGIFTGNLGIGTIVSGPYSLDVSGPVIIRGAGSGYFLVDRYGVSTSAIYRQTNLTRFWDNVGGDRLVINNFNGNVGIGLNPITNLEVSGTVSATRFVGNGASLTSLPSNVMSLADLSDVSKSVNNLFLGWINGANADVTNTVAVGPQVFGAGTNSGFANVAVGNSALYYNTTGRWNSAVGNNAMLYNTTGDYNTVMGFQAGIYNTTGTENTAYGAAAAYWNDTGSQNTSIGRTAGRYNVGGNNNTVLGHAAAQGISSSTVYNNVTAAGYRSLIRITTGNDNTAIGAYSGQNVSSGSSNTIMGYNAGLTLTTGSNNILIGNGANVPANGTSNYLNIGNTIYADMNSNLVGIGTAAPGYALEVKNATQYQGIALRNATNTVFRAYGSTAANDSGVMQLLNSGTVAMQLSGGNGVLTYFTGANVGIGTTAPGYPLVVSGNAVFGGPGSGMGYTIATQAPGGYAGYMGFYLPDGTRIGYIGHGYGPGHWMNLATDGNTALRFVTSGTESMRIDAVGNVGIGVTSPLNPLEIRRDQSASTDVSIRNSSNLTSAAARVLLTADVGSGVLTYNGSGSSVSAYAGGPSGLGIWATGSGGVAVSSKSASGTLRFYTGTTPSERARIDASGNVGINTNAPAATLDVNGYMKLAKNVSAPVACGSTYDGSIALTSARRMCVCDGSSWKEMNNATACTW